MTEDNSIKVISFRAIPCKADGRWSVRMEAEADVLNEGDYTIEGEIHNESTVRTARLEKGRQKITLSLFPESAELWYPKRSGSPHI